MASPYPDPPATEDDLLAVSAVHEHSFHTGPPSGQVHERLGCPGTRPPGA
jgi:hypothetical protein